MRKYLKGCLIALGVGIVLVVVVVAAFLFWYQYSSPVLEAGREYKRNVSSYRGDDVENMKEVFERLAVIDSHYDSVTFDKMQGGEPTDVSFKDLEILFGEADEFYDEAELSFYRYLFKYHYADVTLNFHGYYQDIREYVWEMPSDELYEPAALDALFIDVMNDYRTMPILSTEDEWLKLEETALEDLVTGMTPSRRVSQHGWREWVYTPRFYFDTGEGKYAPEEYLRLDYKANRDEPAYLRLMERRYQAPYKQSHSEAEVAAMEDVMFDLAVMFIESDPSDPDWETILVADLNDAFGDNSRIIYNFGNDQLSISWLMLGESQMREFSAVVDGSELEAHEIGNVADLADLEISDFKYEMVYERNLKSDDFMMSGNRRNE